MWQCQQPWTPGFRDPSLDQIVSSGSNSLTAIPQGDGANLPGQIAPSTGPQRSAGSAKGKGRWTRIPMECLPPGIDWPATYSRFYAEMVKICTDKPTGEVLDPATAYAEINRFIIDDLRLSVSNFFYCGCNRRLMNVFIWRQPLVAKQLGKRPCRDLEQYLTGIITELRPWQKGEKRGIQFTLERSKPITHLRAIRVPTKDCSV